jgi:hypothetical protein
MISNIGGQKGVRNSDVYINSNRCKAKTLLHTLQHPILIALKFLIPGVVSK